MARRVASIAVGLLLALGTAAVPVPGARAEAGGSAPAAIAIYADTDWYRARPEPERRWQGTLHRRAVAGGPGGRSATSFGLTTAEGELPVYAAGAGARLAPFVGRRVAVTGKLVDLRGEGFGRELWIASIAAE